MGTSTLDLRRTDTRVLALDLLRQGATCSHTARVLGISKQRAHQIATESGIVAQRRAERRTLQRLENLRRRGLLSRPAVRQIAGNGEELGAQGLISVMEDSGI